MTQAGGSGLLFRFTGSVMLRGGRGAADSYCYVCVALTVSGHTGFALTHGCVLSPSTLLRLPAALYGAGPVFLCSSSFRVLHKSADSVGPVFCTFPIPSSSGSQELDWHTLPRCSAPSPLCGPSLSFRTHQSGACALCLFLELASSHNPPSGCWPSRISGSLWLETGGLFAVWKGVPSLGPSLPLSPPPCLWQGWADLQWASSSLELLSPFVLRTVSSVFRLVNFLSLSCYHTV